MGKERGTPTSLPPVGHSAYYYMKHNNVIRLLWVYNTPLIDEKQVSVTFHILQHQAHDAVGEWSGRTGGGAGRKASQSNLLQVAA